jgi:hypothetical protein
MWPVFIKRKGKKLGTLNTVVIFYFLYHSIAKTFLLKDFQIKIHFFIFLVLGAFFGKKFGSKKVPHFKFKLLKTYLAEKAEHFISVSRKKRFVKTFIGS